MWARNKALLLENGCEMNRLQTLYIGGGTPSLWGARGAQFLQDLLIREGVELAEGCEFTLEVNPGTWTEDSIKAWKDLGVSRFSLGIQSLRADYLKILDRVHSVDDVFETLKYFNSIDAAFSVDFMLGLPWSESKDRQIENELNEILSFKPEHLSLYILTAKGGYPYKEELPEDDFLETEYLKVANLLKQKGFGHYEVSNFAQKGKESLHNLQYWRGGSVAAVGPSGVGFLSKESLRYKWKTSEASPVLENLNKEEVALEKLYLGLRISDGIVLSDHFDSSELKALRPLFSDWAAKELAQYEEEGHHLSLTSRGYLVLDGLINQIFSRI